MRTIIAGLLLFAAVAKGYEILTSPAPVGWFGLPRWTITAGVCVELALGLWVLTGLYPATARRVVLAAFTLFAGMSLTRALGGQASCGCFGALQVNPWYTVALDLAVIGLLAWASVNRKSPGPTVTSHPARATLAGVLLLACVALFVARPFDPVSVGDGLGEPGQTVVLDPGAWAGRRLPLLPHIQTEADLTRGEWVLVFYHDDCPDCRAELPRWTERATHQEPVLFVSVPPESREYPLIPAGSSHPRGRLTPDRNWFIRTPAVVRIRDGVVTE